MGTKAREIAAGQIAGLEGSLGYDVANRRIDARLRLEIALNRQHGRPSRRPRTSMGSRGRAASGNGVGCNGGMALIHKK